VGNFARLPRRQRRHWPQRAAAENVLVGCADQDCAIRKWAASAASLGQMNRSTPFEIGFIVE